MTTQPVQTTEQAEPTYNRLSIVLFPEQKAVVDQLATEIAETPGRENFSQALRRIINEWAKARQSPPNNT